VLVTPAVRASSADPRHRVGAPCVARRLRPRWRPRPRTGATHSGRRSGNRANRAAQPKVPH